MDYSKEIQRLLTNEDYRNRLLDTVHKGIEDLHCQGRGPYHSLRILEKSFKRLYSQFKDVARIDPRHEHVLSDLLHFSLQDLTRLQLLAKIAHMMKTEPTLAEYVESIIILQDQDNLPKMSIDEMVKFVEDTLRIPETDIRTTIVGLVEEAVSNPQT